jgi:signal transduction histidine kinase
MSDQLVRKPGMEYLGFVLRDDPRVEDLEDRVDLLTQENQRLEKLLNARSQFIRLVTHELKSPVAAVENYLKLILQGYIDLEDQDEILEKCIVRTCEERQLIDDLLDLGMLDDIDDLPAVPVRLDQVLDNVLSECRDDVDDKKIHLTLSVANDIPAIKAVPELMRSVWCNLISNSLKYSPDGGEVSIGLQFQNQTLKGWVMDDGIGISSADQEKIFQEFFRGENARNTSVAGTGLGLVLVKKIVEGLGGKISFESELGAGSTFQFMIPVGKGTLAAVSRTH